MGVTELLASELAAPFERATDADAAAVASRHWGIATERAHRVDTERDDTFELETSDGSYALKLAHPRDDPEVLDLQTSAIEWAAAHDPGLPLARPLLTLDGTRHPVVPVNGVGRIARLAPWLPGQSVRAALWDAAPSAALLHAVGATQARLTVALAEFRHPVERRILAWDVAQLPSLAALIDAVRDPAPVAEALASHLSDVAPKLADLPQQLIHNDGNHDNLLVDDRATRVVAVLDFGDVVRTARVLDLAVTASYLMPADDQYGAADTLTELTRGWDGVLALEPAERALLPRLVVARLLQRLLLASWLTREVPHNAEYLSRNVELTRSQLDLALADAAFREGW